MPKTPPATTRTAGDDQDGGDDGNDDGEAGLLADFAVLARLEADGARGLPVRLEAESSDALHKVERSLADQRARIGTLPGCD